MTLKLFEHPFSSYCQKALVALYENDVPFEAAILEPGGAASAELLRLWPLNKFPVLQDGDRIIPEATVIIEYLQATRPGPVELIPKDPDGAIEVRLMDRFFDNYVSTPQGNIVVESLRPADNRDPYGVTTQRVLLDTAYRWLDTLMATRTWAAGERFSMADCAAAPALLYADWTHPIPETLQSLHAYRSRLLERPSYARALDEARPYRDYFPLGAPKGRD
jgi:glutathione S-transferase